MKKVLLIVNPCAGQKKARRFLMDMVAILNRGDCQVLVHVTAAPGDGEAAVLRYAGEVEQILCCGGDGTFHEVVSGLLKCGGEIPLGYIPAGSTNDFAASLKLSTNLLQATRDTVDGSPVKLDVGRFNDTYFSYVASFGMFTKVSYATPQSVKNILGHAAYALGGIQELSQLKSYPLRFTLEDGTVIQDSFIFGAVSNTFRVGGILTLDAAQVDMSDGSLELLLIRPPPEPAGAERVRGGFAAEKLQRKPSDLCKDCGPHRPGPGENALDPGRRDGKRLQSNRNPVRAPRHIGDCTPKKGEKEPWQAITKSG